MKGEKRKTRNNHLASPSHRRASPGEPAWRKKRALFAGKKQPAAREAEKRNQPGEGFYKELFEESRDAMYLSARDGRLLEVNRAFLDLLGYGPDEARNLNAKDTYVNVADRVRFQRQIEKAGFVRDIETQLKRKDGTRLDCLLTSSVRRSQDGRVAGYQGIIRDITGQRQAERALRESEERFRSLLEAAPDPIVAVDETGKILLVNQQAERVFGYTRAQLLGECIEKLIPERLRKQHVTKWEQFLQNPQTWPMGNPWTLTARHKEGTEFPVDIALSPLQTKAGLLVIMIIHDASERRRVENVLRESELRLRRQNKVLVELSRRMALDPADLRSAIQEITEAAAQTLRLERVGVWFCNEDRNKITCFDLYESTPDRHSGGEELAAASCPKYFAALQEARVIAAEAAQRDPRMREYSKGYLEPLGIAALLNAPIRVQGRIAGVVCHEHIGAERRWTAEEQNFAGSMADLVSLVLEQTERRHAEEALRQSEEQHRVVLDNIDEIVYAVGLKDRYPDGAAFEFVSHHVEHLLGYEPEAFRRDPGLWLRLVHPDDAPGFREIIVNLIARRQSKTRIYRLRRKDQDRYVWVEDRIVPQLGADGRVIGFFGVARDITERQNLQQQLFQSQKMEAVGQLAGGIAHDFNNLLMVIRGYTDLMLSHASRDEGLYRNLAEVRKATDRATALTQQLLAFSRKQVMRLELLDLNRVVRDMERMLRRLLGESIELLAVLGSELGRVKADPAQVEQVILNLALNARDAMPDGGRLTVETSNYLMDESFVREQPGSSPGSYVRLRVSDTGAGMDSNTVAHIFEPFFTTKEKGKGTGLGLATVYGIVKQSGGYIVVSSEAGKGTTFDVYLPRAAEAVDPSQMELGTAQAQRGCETILVVEDEDAVRELTAEFLTGYGYEILSARDGQEAVQLARQHSGPIHLLVTDVVMPGIGGRELARRLKAQRPEMQSMYVSGYTDFATAERFLADPDTVFLQKPFSLEALARTVRKILDDHGARVEAS